jgi:hypothetical protein
MTEKKSTTIILCRFLFPNEIPASFPFTNRRATSRIWSIVSAGETPFELQNATSSSEIFILLNSKKS